MRNATGKHHVFAALREIGPSDKHLARLLGVTPGVISGVRRRHQGEWRAAVAAWKAAGGTSSERYGVSPPPAPPVPEPPPRDPVEVEQERLARLKGLREERQALREVAGEKSLRTMLELLIHRAVPVFPLPKARPIPTVSAEAEQETLLLVLSDFHGFELVSPEATRGLNEYSGFIMCQRAHRVVESVLSIKQRMERGGGWVFPKLVIALNGDMVSGTIHEVERHTDAQNIVTATYGVGLLVAAMVQDLAAAFGEVEVFCISGNHGRLPDARKMQSKDPLRNFDTLIALTAKEVTRQLPNVSWHIPNAYAVAYDIEGWTVLQQHGDNVPPGALSVPLYGIDRQVRNINALEAQRGGAGPLLRLQPLPQHLDDRPRGGGGDREREPDRGDRVDDQPAREV